MVTVAGVPAGLSTWMVIAAISPRAWRIDDRLKGGLQTSSPFAGMTRIRFEGFGHGNLEGIQGFRLSRDARHPSDSLNVRHRARLSMAGAREIGPSRSNSLFNQPLNTAAYQPFLWLVQISTHGITARRK